MNVHLIIVWFCDPVSVLILILEFYIFFGSDDDDDDDDITVEIWLSTI
jgi:hypothetical protein